jgi:hypothetical protein
VGGSGHKRRHEEEDCASEQFLEGAKRLAEAISAPSSDPSSFAAKELGSVATRKSPTGIGMRIPVRDCMNEGRITTHGWGACTSVEGTRAPSMGDAIDRTIDLARPPWEKISLGQNRVTVYSTSRSPHL